MDSSGSTTDAHNQKRPAKGRLSTHQHAAFRENAELVVFMPPARADNTKLNGTGISKNYFNERQRLDVAACYLTIAYTGCRPADAVDGEQNILLDDVCWEELFGSQANLPLRAPSEDVSLDAQSKHTTRLLELETQHRGRPKALCYEDIQ
ncbi:hypothetical protein EDB89DRAFT_2067685 [Lactarius sanguifluus]|nr:hypothetical protein EDB89DRAFT_2067685 [Lactarius sanguifluus]